MDFLHVRNRGIVLISEKAREYVSPPAQNEFNVIEVGDIREEIRARLDARGDDHLLAVLLAHVDEYPECRAMLNGSSFGEISYQFILFGGEEAARRLNLENLRDISEFRMSPLTGPEFVIAVRKTLLAINDIYINRSLEETYLAKLIDTKKDQDDLVNIGRSLSIEKDQDKLLRLILFLSKRITGADAGSIFLVERDEEGKKHLRFKYSHTYSREIPLEERVIPMDKKSISGYVAVTGQVVNIPDAYRLPPDAPYSFNTTIDQKYQYRSKSMLVVPMKNHADEVIGVIQLLNCKENLEVVSHGGYEAFTIKLGSPEDFDRYVVTFDRKYNSLMESVAGQAAIAMENNRMIMQIQNQFEEFVKASVFAIESRDPATSGHSFRVADICTAMAAAVNEVQEGYLKDFCFTEIQIKELELAALLHDFGKVYIDLAVFRKAKKLYPKDFDNLYLRLNYLFRFIELEYASKEAELLKTMKKNGGADQAYDDLIGEKNRRLGKIKTIKEKLCRMNEPALLYENLEETLGEIISEIEQVECVNMDGELLSIISPADRVNLSITRGNLNPTERKEIESHVTYTYSFVSKIPWPPEYKNIPEIALRHHEKMDGTGYPDGLRGRESTLLQSRIMAIADIFDALVAGDRPYKKSVPLARVLEILNDEAQSGVLDRDLVQLFIDRKIYTRSDMHTKNNMVKEHAS